MALLDWPASEVLSTSFTLAEYLALPEDSRCEIVDGVLRPMTRSGLWNRTVDPNLPWVDIDVTDLLGRFA